MEIAQLKIDKGDMFSSHEIQTAAKVCILGKTVVDNLFPGGESPLGKVIRFNNIPMQVVGTLESKGYNSMGMDQDDRVLAPFTTVQKRVLAINYIQSMVAMAVSTEYTNQAIDEMSDILRRNHKLRDGESNDFEIRSMEEMLSTISTVMDMLTLLLGAVAAISLIVGGIGIMNIMYVSVTERTREIGLRMSIGAKGRDILTQFLIESVLISITGGLIGVIFGSLVSALANVVLNATDIGITTYVQPWSVLVSFAVCTFTGVFFGWYPAKKASQLDPIEALRYE
jgi:putative ABC transport system permease protein